MSFYTNGLTGTRTEYTYTPSGAVASLRTYAGEEIVSDMEYEYDLRGNQTKKTEDGRTTEYYYDALSRLKTALLPNGITQDYEFDDYGNIIRMAQVRGFSVEESNYCYDKNNRLLLKETVSDGKTVRDCYTYDAAGNTVRKETFTEENGVSTSAGTEYTYNGRNQLCNVALSSGESFAYTYNAEGLRSSKVSGDGTVNYVYQNGSILLETDGDGAVTAENIWGIRLLERRTSEADYAYRFDGHGDIIALTDEHGTALEDYSYDPYGVDLREETTDIRNWESDSLTPDNPFRYCGEYQDEESGLYYLRARYYDSGTGRFLSEDSTRARLMNLYDPYGYHQDVHLNGGVYVNWNLGQYIVNDPVSLNQYTYCYNNPVKYTDANGHMPWVLIGAGVGALVGIGFDIYRQISSGANFDSLDLKSILISAAAGAISGAIGASGVPLLGQIVANAAISGTESVVKNVASGSAINWKQAAINTGIGALAGMAGGTGLKNVSKVTYGRIVSAGTKLGVYTFTYTSSRMAQTVAKEFIKGTSKIIGTNIFIEVVGNKVQITTTEK